jgi:hypothetical protein
VHRVHDRLVLAAEYTIERLRRQLVLINEVRGNAAW